MTFFQNVCENLEKMGKQKRKEYGEIFFYLNVKKMKRKNSKYLFKKQCFDSFSGAEIVNLIFWDFSKNSKNLFSVNSTEECWKYSLWEKWVVFGNPFQFHNTIQFWGFQSLCWPFSAAVAALHWEWAVGAVWCVEE